MARSVPIEGSGGALPATNVVIELFRDLVLRVRDQNPGLVPADEEPAFSLSLSLFLSTDS